MHTLKFIIRNNYEIIQKNSSMTIFSEIPVIIITSLYEFDIKKKKQIISEIFPLIYNGALKIQFMFIGFFNRLESAPFRLFHILSHLNGS